MENSNELLNILALCVALLAVIVGPLVSWIISKHQSKISLHISNKQVIAPIKKEWVYTLQRHVAEILSTSLWFYISGQDEIIISGDKEEYESEAMRVERKLIFLIAQVELILLPSNKEHMALLNSLKSIQRSVTARSNEHMSFPDYHQESIELCQKIVRHEFVRIEDEIKKI